MLGESLKDLFAAALVAAQPEVSSLQSDPGNAVPSVLGSIFLFFLFAINH